MRRTEEQREEREAREARRLARLTPEQRQCERDEIARRKAFATMFGCRRVKWSDRALSRLIRRAGPDRAVGEIIRRLLYWPHGTRVFDHGELWARDGAPWAIVGHPYSIDDEARETLAQLAGLPGVVVAIDDVASYYGHGTHHIRIAARD